jgi:hypothetical protein
LRNCGKNCGFFNWPWQSTFYTLRAAGLLREIAAARSFSVGNLQFDSFRSTSGLLPVFAAVQYCNERTICGIAGKIAVFQLALAISILYVTSCGIAAGNCGWPQFFS